jgi:hypothetical protein
MCQTIGTNYFCAGIAEDGELAIDDFFPDGSGVFTVVHADCYHARLETVEIFFVLRELAQFPCAIRSPVSPIKNQQDPLAPKRRQAELPAVFIFQGEIWCWFTLR